MGKTLSEPDQTKEGPVEARLVLTGADIVGIGPDAELLVGGKNYNTAIISRVQGVRIPQFRAISSLDFHTGLDESLICAELVPAWTGRRKTSPGIRNFCPSSCGRWLPKSGWLPRRTPLFPVSS